MSFAVYVAAPFEDGPFVRIIHERLVKMGLQPVSKWAETATSTEDFSRHSPARLRAIAVSNDEDLSHADVVLVLARGGAGGEMFAEARLAIEWRKPIVWVGRLTLSAWRPGVIRASDYEDGLTVLADLQKRHASGLRGQLLTYIAAGDRP